ncbi:putative membrane protein [Planomicrobium stackebrandtii]|uniref:Membrane protein n=2 Tax=Planomicrobium stackebrandtii TaxID=253160 RepID=A0ABU0GWL0_9BACL|nr:putative membrane protein [Planomicrobium stackebrandtii]
MMENTGLKILVHASAFFAPFLVPVIVFLISQDKEVKKLSIQALLFQLALGVLIFISSLLIVFIIGIPMLIVFGLMGIIIPIMGIIRALNNEQFDYPIVGSWYQ